MEQVPFAAEPPAPTQPQPQGTNLPNEAEAAHLDALRAEAAAQEAEPTEV